MNINFKKHGKALEENEDIKIIEAVSKAEANFSALKAASPVYFLSQGKVLFS